METIELASARTRRSITRAYALTLLVLTAACHQDSRETPAKARTETATPRVLTVDPSSLAREGLRSSKPGIRMALLTSFGDRDLQAVLTAAKDPSWLVRSAAINTLAAHHSKAAQTIAPVIEEALLDHDRFVRFQAFLALQELHGLDKRTIVMVLGGLNATTTPPGDTASLTADLHPLHKRLVTDWLALRQQMERDDSDIVEYTVALEQLDPLGSDAIPPLVAALKHHHKYVRFAAARSLRTLGADAAAALPALRHATKDQEEIVRNTARVAIAEIETDRIFRSHRPQKNGKER